MTIDFREPLINQFASLQETIGANPKKKTKFKAPDKKMDSCLYQLGLLFWDLYSSQSYDSDPSDFRNKLPE